NLLLNRGRRPPEAPPAWLVDLGRRLDARVSTEFENTPAREAVAQLAARAEVPIVLPPHVEEEVSLVLDDVPLRTALGWIARQFELRVALEDGAIVLTENPRPRIEIYEVGELIAPRRAGEGDGEVDGAFLREQLVELIRQHVDPESWEWDPRRAIQPFADD